MSEAREAWPPSGPLVGRGDKQPGSGHRHLLAEQRRELILAEVRRRGGVRVNELTSILGVSDMTVRRDLDALAQRGQIAKVHGGAVPVGDASSHEPGFEAKSALELAAKAAIAQAARSLVLPGSAIALSAGTTTYALAQHLVGIEDLTVVTNSLHVAEVFDRSPVRGTARAATVVLTGGVRTPSDALVGPVADQAVRSLHFDLVFLGCHGMSAESGLTTPNLAEAETNRSFVHSARRVVVVADHTKWGIVGLSTFARLAEVDTLITDTQLDGEVLATLRDQIEEVIVAEEAVPEVDADGAGAAARPHPPQHQQRRSARS